MTVSFEDISSPAFWTSPEDLRSLLIRNDDDGVRLKYLPTDPDNYDAPGAVVMDMPAGFVLYRHSHECDRVEIIVRGSLDIGGRILDAGGIMTADAGTEYGPHVVLEGGATTVEFFTRFSAAWKPVYATATGPVQVDLLAGELPPPDRVGWPL
jgi:hypothetical protein